MVFIGNIFIQEPDKNLNYRLLLLGDKIDGNDKLKNKVVEQHIDIRHLFPRWILQKTRSDFPDTHIVRFTQAYYDWLYNLSGYKLSVDKEHDAGLRELVDIGTTPDTFLKHFTYTYASGFPDAYIEVADTRKFIQNIRQSLYQKKGTEESYVYFFSELFGADKTQIQFVYPKEKILRLNGGKFGDWQVITDVGQTGHYGGAGEDSAPILHLGGSYLNGDFRIQDSYWYQEYSYLVKANIEETDENGLPIYAEMLKEVLHPAGMKGFWEKTGLDYVPPGDFDGGFYFCESPRLDNYFPYRINATGSIGYCAGCSGSGHTYDGPTGMGKDILSFGGELGWTYGSAWNGIGPGGICISGTQNHAGDVWGGNTLSSQGLGETFGAPTHFYPDWSDGITGEVDAFGIPISASIGSIYIGEFIRLCPMTNSPNLGLTGCTASTC
jgi:hypothetical protein